MALQKTYESDSGASCNYWKVTYLLVDYARQAVECHLCLFVDAAASAAGKQAAHLVRYEWGATEFASHFEASVLDTVNYNPQERAYDLIKTLTDPVDFTTGTTDV